MFANRFSFPINVEEIFINKTIGLEWFKRYADVICEVYIGSLFLNINTKDMNGVNVDIDPQTIEDFLIELNTYGIDTCVVFNDIFEEDPDLFRRVRMALENRPYITSIVVPDRSWLKMKYVYPDLKIKNTVINLPTIRQVRDGAFDGYDYIYVHDEIIHNHDAWLEIKGDRKFGTVVNYGQCVTSCRVKHDHYRMIKNGEYEIDHFCPTAEWTPLQVALKRCAIPGMVSEYKYYLDVIDVYKLQGRNSTGTFPIAVNIIESVVDGCNDLFGGSEHIRELHPIDRYKWKIQVRNCGGVCHKCGWCDEFIQ